MTDYIEKIIKEIKSIDKKRFPESPIATCGSLIAVCSTYIFLGCQLENYFDLKGAAYHATGAAAYLTGKLADDISTIKCMKADKEFYRKHGFHTGSEENPLLPYHPTAKDLFGITKKGAVAGIIDFLFLAYSAISPPVGLGFLTARSFACSNNSMAAKQTKLMDKLLEERMPNASAAEKKKFLKKILEEKEAKAK